MNKVTNKSRGKQYKNSVVVYNHVSYKLILIVAALTIAGILAAFLM